MNDLIERLEKSFGPDFGIDRAIAAVLEIEWSADEEGQFGGYGIMPRRVRFTASIDAALTLVPRGWSWRVGNLPRGTAFADLGTQKSLQCVEGHTPAIALCIAALKARAPKEQKPDETRDSDT